MSKLITLFGLIVKDPSVLLSSQILNRSYLADAPAKKNVSQKYSLPNGLPTVDLLTLIPNLKETIQPYSFLEGTSLPTDLALLKGLARRFPRCSFLEIGTWRGESVSNVASTGAECVSLSLSPQEMKEMDMSTEFIANHNFFSKQFSNVEHIGHNSQSFDYSKLNRKFDLIFIDGDHSYQSVRTDTRNVFGVLRDKSSIIVWHDYGYGPESIRWSVLAGILDGCPHNKRNHLYHVSNTMCAIYIDQDVTTDRVRTLDLPNKQFRLEISAERI
jgi:predicted O-methyltransferase YrrM